VEEQQLVGRILHLISNEQPDLLMKMMMGVRKLLGLGGVRRIVHTLPALVFAYFRLIQLALTNADANVKIIDRAFTHILEFNQVLRKEDAEQAFKLYLQAILVADQANRESVLYEITTQSFIIFEENINDTKAQFAALVQTIAALQACKNVSEEQYGNLAAQTCKSALRSLKKPDQCQLLSFCSHLFWKGAEHPLSEPKRMMECLQKAMKVIGGCMPPQQLPLYVELLNRFLYYYEDAAVEQVTSDHINFLFETINKLAQQHAEEEPSKDDANLASVSKYYENTQRYVEYRKGLPDGDRWKDIAVS